MNFKRYICSTSTFLVLAIFVMQALAANESGGEIKMVVTAGLVSSRGIPVYNQLAGYLTKKLNRKVVIISGTTYSEADMLLERGIIQVGFVCGYPYTQNVAAKKYSLLAIPVVSTTTGRFSDVPFGYEKTPGKYYSYTIVRKDSPLKSWQDIKGKSYSFNDQTSNSGYNMPRYKLVQLGAKRWEDYFSRIVVSGSHEESIRLVSQGLVDASSVDSLVLDYDRFIGNADALNVRVIEQLFPSGAGAPPVVFSSKADPAIRKPLQEALVNMHKDPEGKQILASAHLTRFDLPNDANYDDIRRMEASARKVGFRDYTPK